MPVRRYARDLNRLPDGSGLVERTASLRSCISPIDSHHEEVAIGHAIPVPGRKDAMAEKEALSIEGIGSPSTFCALQCPFLQYLLCECDAGVIWDQKQARTGLE